MLARPMLIATIATVLSMAAFSPRASADPVGGAIVGGALGAVVGGPPGAAVGAILGTAIGTDAYYRGPDYGYTYPSPSDVASVPGNAPPPVAYYPPHYRPAPAYYAPPVVYARPAYVYGPPVMAYYPRPRYYAGRYDRGNYRRYR